MPLDKQNVPIPFGQGLDTKTDPKQVQPGKLTVLQNGIFQTGKEIRKRNGFAALSQSTSTGGTISSGVGVSNYSDELIELDGTTLYSYNSGGSNWVSKGTLVNTRLSTTTVLRNNTQQTIQDSAINGSFRCFVWYDSVGQLGYSVFDTTTNQSIVNNQVVDANGLKVKVLALGSYFVIIYYESGTNHLKYRAINIATPMTIASAVDIATDINTTNYAFDATVFNSRIYIAYGSTTSNRISMYYLDNTLTKSSQLNVAGSNDAFAISVFGDASNQAWVSYSGSAGGNHVYVFVANPNLSATVLASTSLDTPSGSGAWNITGIVSGTVATVYYETIPTSNHKIKQNTMTLSGTSGTASNLLLGIGLGSKVFSYGGVNYMVAAYQSTLQSTYFLVDGSGNVVAKLSPDLGGGYTAKSILPEMNAVSSGVYQTASLIKDFLFSSAGNTFTQTGVLSATFTFSTSAPNKFILGQNLHIAGGILQMYDGASVVEHGYNIYPEGLTASLTTSATSGTATLLGTAFGVGTAASSATSQIQYSGVYEWTDNEGQIHRSAPSIPVTLNAGIAGGVTTFAGTMGTSSSNITGVTATNLAVGQYVFAPDYVHTLTPNGTISSITGGGGTVTISHSTGTLGISGGTAFYVSQNPVAWISVDTSQANYALGSTTLTSVSTKYANLAVGQLLIGGENADGAQSCLSPNTYITAISGTAGGVVTITISNPLIYVFDKTNFSSTIVLYSYDTASATIAFPTLRLTNKNKVALALYKTEVNGTQFYRTTNTLTYNDKTVDSVTITDSTPDSVLIGNQQLYTTGEIENIEAPAISACCTFKSRAIVIPSENKLSWWFSKQVIPGSPVEFTDTFVKNIDSRIVEIDAVGVIDEKIIFFGPTSKYYVVGDGPAASGANDDFAPAEHITGSTGCSNQASILEIPIGLIYQDATKGIYLLDRSLQEIYIGQEVESYNGDPITSAQTIPGTTTVRFTMTSGSVLTYDWFYQQWGDNPYASEAITSTLSHDKFTYVQANGLVQQEASGTYSDNGTAITLSLTTGWISFAGVQGFQRVYELLILGNYKSPHTLNVVIYSNNDDTTPTQTVTIPVTSDPTNYEYRVRIVKQKCTSIKIKIYDSNQSGTLESLSLSSLGFVVGVKKGQNKLPAGSSY